MKKSPRPGQRFRFRFRDVLDAWRRSFGSLPPFPSFEPIKRLAESGCWALFWALAAGNGPAAAETLDTLKQMSIDDLAAKVAETPAEAMPQIASPTRGRGSR